MKKIIFCLLALWQTSIFATYYSQVGQDQYINETFFKNKRNGFFLDIGAHKGVEISNSYFFETELHWQGICIEPIPELFDELIENRHCICLQGCISDREGTAQFIQFPGGGSWFSGLKDKFEDRQLENLNHHGLKEYDLIEVKCYLFNKILESYGIYHVDFLSIDTEGGELDILKSIDYSKFNIDVITVENNYNDPSYASFMKTKGFRLVKRLGQDDVYVNKKFKY